MHGQAAGGSHAALQVVPPVRACRAAAAAAYIHNVDECRRSLWAY